AHRRAALPADHGPARLLLVHRRASGAMSVATAGVDSILRDHGLADALEAVGGYAAAQRWSGGLGRGVRDVSVDDAAVLADAEAALIFTVTRITYDDGSQVRFALPLGLRQPGDPLAERAPDYMIG